MGKVNSVNRSFMSVRQLSTAGLLVGITIFLGISGYGFIPLFAVNATILHIPTIIGAMAAGPKVGPDFSSACSLLFRLFAHRL